MPKKTKWCCNCDTDKPLEDFNRHKKKPDGRQTFCRECQRIQYGKNKDVLLKQASERQAKAYREDRQIFRERNRRWRRANPEKVAELNRRYRERHPEVGKKNLKRYYERYPEREKANRIVSKAVQTGKLPKPPGAERTP